MDCSKDYYKILGVDKNASKKDIEAAYKKMIRKWHPDLFASKSKEEQDRATAMSADINEANDILSDEQKRQEYDMMREGGGIRGGRFSGFSDFNPFSTSMDSVYDALRRGYGFAQFHRQNTERTPTVGRTIGINVELPFEDFFFGCKKTLEIKVRAKCEHCDNGLVGDVPKYTTCRICAGTGVRVSVNGNMMIQETCQSCDGTGKVLENKCKYCNGLGVGDVTTRTVEFEIPKDSRGIYTKKYKGIGHHGVYGGGDGDIVVTARMGNGGMFYERSDGALGTIHYVSLFKALAGGIEAILTPYGSKNIMIPSCMEDCHEIKFSGMGLKGKNGEPDGDLVVMFKYDMPKKLDGECIEKLSKIAEASNSDQEAFPNVAAERAYAKNYLGRLS